MSQKNKCGDWCILAPDAVASEYAPHEKTPRRLDCELGPHKGPHKAQGWAWEHGLIGRADPVVNHALELGARAMALILKHEWSGWEDWVGDGGFPVCLECRQMPPDGDAANYTSDEANERRRNPGRIGHKPDCEWGALVADFKKAKGDPDGGQ